MFLAVTSVFGCGFWLWLWFLVVFGVGPVFLVVVVVFVLKGVVGRGWVWGCGSWLGLGFGSWLGCGFGVWVVGDGVGLVVVVFGCDRCFWFGFWLWLWFLVVFGLDPVFLVVVF